MQPSTFHLQPSTLQPLPRSAQDVGPNKAEALKEFESVFLSMMIKQMRESISEEGLFPGDSSDTLGGLFDMFIGQHISESGGVGIAESLQAYIKAKPGA